MRDGLSQPLRAVDGLAQDDLGGEDGEGVVVGGLLALGDAHGLADLEATGARAHAAGDPVRNAIEDACCIVLQEAAISGDMCVFREGARHVEAHVVFVP